MKRKSESRIDLEENALLKSLRQSVSQFINENEFHTSSSIQAKTEIDHTEECWINYGKRLASFTNISKLSQPKELSPSNCARHGWSFFGGDLLQCDECKKIISISTPSLLSSSTKLFNFCVRNVQRKFLEGHDVCCSWRTNRGLNITLTYNIMNRYKLLDGNVKEVPLANNIIDESYLSQFSLENKFILITAISGWIPSSNKDVNRIECLLCGRKLCLLVFEDNPLNLLEQHYSFCPIIDKEFPLWRETILATLPQVKEKESLLSSVAKVKNLLNNIFKK